MILIDFLVIFGFIFFLTFKKVDVLSLKDNNYQLHSSSYKFFLDFPFFGTINLANNRKITLRDSRVSFFDEKKLLWQSPSDWQVKKIKETDLNCDGKNEIALLLWKEKDETRWHAEKKVITGWHSFFYLYDFSNSEPHALWKSSVFLKPLTDFDNLDLDADNCQELITIEGEYHTDHRDFKKTGTANVLKWNGFGFGKEWESQYASYQRLFNIEHSILLIN